MVSRFKRCYGDVHLLHVLLHLDLPVIVGYLGHEGSAWDFNPLGRRQPAPALLLPPNGVILLEALGFLPELGEDAAGEVHGLECLLSQSHVGIDAV